MYKQKTENKHTYLNMAYLLNKDLISRGKQCCSNNIEIDSLPNHVFKQTWSIIMIIIIMIVITTVILIIINSYIIIKDTGNDSNDENNAHNEDSKKYEKIFKK